MAPTFGVVFDRSWPAAAVLDVAIELDEVPDLRLWLIEDCFFTAAQPLAAAALAVTKQLSVGLGILPAVLRNPALAAMEIATLAQLGPGRVVAGIGHGVQDWMAQVGARAPSPLTALTEVLDAVRRLLAGETVTVDGEHVVLRDVALAAPPSQPVPVLAGVRGPRSLEAAGRHADGVLLAEPAPAPYVREALAAADGPDGFLAATYTVLAVTDDGAEARRHMAPWLDSMLADPNPGVRALPAVDELREIRATRGVDGLAAMSAERWRAVAAIGDRDDAETHVGQLVDAGVDHVAFALSPDLRVARGQLGTAIDLAVGLGS